MSAQLNSLIRTSKDLETQIEQLTVELSRLHEEIVERMGDRREYYGQGVVAKKWAHGRWNINLSPSPWASVLVLAGGRGRG